MLENASNNNGSNISHKNRDFYFQWHLTDRCNLRCKHCYQEDYTPSSELDLDELKNIADEMNYTLQQWNREGRIALTGGEPFIRRDLFDLLQYLDKLSYVKKVGILTNGTLIRDKIDSLKKFKKLYYLQLSIEGRRNKNDEIRGKGVFDKVIESTNLLYEENIPIRWMITLHKNNVMEVPHIINLAKNNHVDTLTFERLIPTGSGKAYTENILSPSELEDTYRYIVNRSDEEFSKGSPLTILKLRTLWVLIDPKRAENECQNVIETEVGAACSVGLDSLCILPDATVLPCRRLPIPIGNLKKESIFKIWYTSNILWDIRNKNNLKGKCKDCEYIPRCSGCRATAYAVTGDYLAEDPQCWKKPSMIIVK